MQDTAGHKNQATSTDCAPFYQLLLMQLHEAHLHVHKDLVLCDVVAYGVCNIARARLWLKLWLEVFVRVRIVLRRVYWRRLSWRLRAKGAPRGCTCREV